MLYSDIKKLLNKQTKKFQSLHMGKNNSNKKC